MHLKRLVCIHLVKSQNMAPLTRYQKRRKLEAILETAPETWTRVPDTEIDKILWINSDDIKTTFRRTLYNQCDIVLTVDKPNGPVESMISMSTSTSTYKSYALQKSETVTEDDDTKIKYRMVWYKDDDAIGKSMDFPASALLSIENEKIGERENDGNVNTI